ncbi:MAG: arginine--tRNA ligase [Oscillospiraceae bacterium]|nr:arginine--tRNA ligase [Oscillospiraceae bacterium]
MADLKHEAALQLKDLLKTALDKAMQNQELIKSKIPDFLIEVPSNPKNGDFATNLAMVGARVFKTAPCNIAKAITNHISLKGSYFERFDIAGPGFINFFLNRSWFSQSVRSVLCEGENYGKTNFGKGEKWIVEFVSANPTGPMHIGNARGGAIGDCLAEALSWAGYEVIREFYVNDAGNQIEKFKKSLSLRYQQIVNGENNLPLPEDCYQGADITDLAKDFYNIHKDKYINLSEEERGRALVDYALPINIRALKNDLLKYRIKYDNWFLESTLHSSGEIDKIIKKLDSKKLIYNKDGALWLKLTECNCEKDEVLVRANGIPTYFAADIAYHYNKLVDRGFKKAIDIWGADHHGHVARLKGALLALDIDPSRLDVVLMQMVRLVRDGKTVKVSKRSGKSITLVSLLDEIPIDAARFFFNTKEANSHFDFDLDLAVEESSKNPVYYLQYAHARICSIMKNLADLGYKPTIDANYDLLTKPEEIDLIRLLARFPSEIVESARLYDPSRITKFTIDLASRFHKFYGACKVKGSEDDMLTARLNLCFAVKIVLKNALSILKVDAPESM